MQISDVQVSFDGDSTELEDIARCVRNIILTPAGTCPLYRDFGISYDSVSHPVQVAMNEVHWKSWRKSKSTSRELTPAR